MLVPAMIAVIIPIGMMAAHAAREPSLAAAIWDKPLSAIQVLIGLVFWAAIFLIPIKNMLARLGRERIIRIQAGHVYVTDKHIFFRKKWVVPLSAFRGLAHNVRATHSGARQELFLVHGDKRRSLLLHTSDNISHDVIEKACHLLDKPQLPSRDLYFSFGDIRKRVTARKSSSILAPVVA